VTQLRIRRLGYALGAEITGIDLARPLDDATLAQIRQAWLDHLLLCFPGQNLRQAEFVAFSDRMGDVDRACNPSTRDLENRDVILVTNKPRGDKPWDGHKQGQTWHSDQSYTLRPNLGTILLAKELPDVGGETIWANQYLAYETLSPTLRGIVERLSAVHDNSRVEAIEQARDFARTGLAIAAGRRKEKSVPVVHPAVKLHPETHRKALYVGGWVSQFEGMTEEESRPLIDFLVAHAVRYEFTYRHRWSVNDVIVWDNRCLMHYAVSDYDLLRQPRHLWRCPLRGPEAGHLYGSTGEGNRLQAEPSRAVG
jgi:taurine dioxygenase